MSLSLECHSFVVHQVVKLKFIVVFVYSYEILFANLYTQIYYCILVLILNTPAVLSLYGYQKDIKKEISYNPRIDSGDNLLVLEQ